MDTSAVVSGGARAVAPEVLDAAARAVARRAETGQAGQAKAAQAVAGQAKVAASRAPAARAPAKKAKAAPKPKVKSTGQGAVKLPAKGYASATQTAPEYSFLKDPSLSVEEKLILLLATQKKKADAEIEGILKKAEAQKAEPAKKKSGGLLGSVTKVFDVAKVAIPALGLADKMMGGKLDALLKQMSGPALAAAATAAGFPMLAPVAMQLGPKLAEAVLDAKVSGGSEKSTSAEKKGQGGELDSVELARVKLLQDRMSEWTSLVSNMMQSIHQGRMNVIQNLR